LSAFLNYEVPPREVFSGPPCFGWDTLLIKLLLGACTSTLIF